MTIDWRAAVPYGVWLVAGLGLGWLVVVATQPRTDYKAALDQQIEQSWMNGREVVDALEFFENGGIYENRDVEDHPSANRIDQDYVIPLIRLLRDKHGLQVLAILHHDIPNTAMAVIAEAPSDREARNEVRQTILDATESFPGLAMQNWSHHWVSLDFFDEQESSVFQRSGAYDRLKDSQRRME